MRKLETYRVLKIWLLRIHRINNSQCLDFNTYIQSRMFRRQLIIIEEIQVLFKNLMKTHFTAQLQVFCDYGGEMQLFNGKRQLRCKSRLFSSIIKKTSSHNKKKNAKLNVLEEMGVNSSAMRTLENRTLRWSQNEWTKKDIEKYAITGHHAAEDAEKDHVKWKTGLSPLE